MNILNNKIILFINRVAQYTTAGFYFWMYLFRGGFVYGLVPAGIGLIHSIESIHNEVEYSIRISFEEAYQKHKDNKLLSFVVFFLTVISLISVYYSLVSVSPVLGFFQFPLVFFTFFAWIYYIYCIYFLADPPKGNGEKKWIYALAFDTCIRRFFNSMIILATLIAISFLVRINLLVFLFFAPPLTIFLTKYIVPWPK